MTLASQELHLTQSGVSQHIKAFEDALGLKLFDRIKQRLVPTSAAQNLFERASRNLLGLEEAVSVVKGEDSELSGMVTIGVPIEFGNNVIIPLLSKFSKKHPGVKFTLRLGFASAMNDKILNGEFDFAFVDDFRMDRGITIESVYDEVLELCITPDSLKKPGNPKHLRKYYEGLDYVEYQKDEPILRMWFAHHLNSKNLNLTVRATVMDVQGVAHFILNGLGAGVLPGHLVLKLQEEGNKLYTFKGCGKPLKNQISMAYLRERTQSTAARSVMEWLRSSFKP